MTSTGTPINQSINQSSLINKSINQSINQPKGKIQYSSIWLPDTLQTRDLLVKAEKLRSQDNWTKARLAQEAFTEYITRHSPGNPALPLTHWTGGTPLSIAAQEKLSKTEIPPAGNSYTLRCRFCGTWFETDEDMAQPACPKCTKPEAAT